MFQRGNWFTHLHSAKLSETEEAHPASSSTSLPGRHLVQMTRRDVAKAERAKMRLLRTASVERKGTARVEAVGLERIDRARHVAFQDHALARGAGLGDSP